MHFVCTKLGKILTCQTISFIKLLMYFLNSFIKCMMQMAYKYDISRKIVQAVSTLNSDILYKISLYFYQIISLFHTISSTVISLKVYQVNAQRNVIYGNMKHSFTESSRYAILLAFLFAIVNTLIISNKLVEIQKQVML